MTSVGIENNKEKYVFVLTKLILNFVQKTQFHSKISVLENLISTIVSSAY